MDLEHYREELRNLQGRLKGDVSGLSGESFRKGGGGASGNLSNTPVHLADLGSDVFEQECSLGLLENSASILEQVSQALVRLQNGTYGRCEDCENPIGEERLEAIPYTRYCIHCADRNQRDDGGED